MKAQEYLLAHSTEFLSFLRTKIPVYHLSNIFYRDVFYIVIAFLAERGMKTRPGDAEGLARAWIEKLVRERILGPIDAQTWVVQYPEFRTPVRKVAAAPAKPAPAAASVPGAAGPSGMSAAKPAAPTAAVTSGGPAAKPAAVPAAGPSSAPPSNPPAASATPTA
jgi:hypothetical protein